MKGDRTNDHTVENLRRYMLVLCISILLLLVSGPRPSRCAQGDISVSREKDKTVYSIDSNDESRLQQERERDKVWDMLRNMPVIIDGRQNQSTPARPVPPGPVQPVQPAPGK